MRRDRLKGPEIDAVATDAALPARADAVVIGGGAARGVSGPSSWSYLAGNGLLSAVVLGRLAGVAAGGGG